MATLPNDLRDLPPDFGSQAPLPPQQAPAFNRGLRAGTLDLRGQGRALLGQAGETLGAPEYAAEQRALSLRHQQAGAQVMEGLPQSYTDVHSLSDAWDYGTGLVGRALPGLVPMAIGGMVGGIPGAIAATAPSTIGAQFEAQQNDPVQAAAPLAQRNLTGIGAGGLEAGVMNVVPGMMATKLFGKLAEGAAAKEAMPLGKAVMQNAPEAIVGNAAAGYVAPAISQVAATSLNPNRDTSHDGAERMEGAVGGAVMGVPFAALGTVGSMRGQKAAPPKAAFELKTEPAAGSETKPGAPKAEAPKTFDEHLADIAEAVKPELITSEEHANAKITGNETVETMAAHDAAGHDEATAKAQKTIDKLLADPEAAHLHEQLKQLDPTNNNGRSAIGKLNAEHFTAQKIKRDIKAANDALGAAKADTEGAKSEDYSGAERGIYEAMDGPEWADFDDVTRYQAARMVRGLIEHGEQGDLPPEALRGARHLGDNLTARLTKIYNKLGSGDPQARENFFKALNRVSKVAKYDNDLEHTVRTALPPHVNANITGENLGKLMDGLKALTGENLTKMMGAHELEAHKNDLHAKLETIFGAKTEKVLDAFAKHAKDAEELVPSDVEERAKQKGAGIEHDDEGDTPPGEGVTHDDGTPNYVGEQDKYYGRTPNKHNKSPFVLNNLAHTERFPANSAESRPQNERMAHAQRENPKDDVRWMGAREFADATGMSREDLMRHTMGRPDDYGLAATRSRGADEHVLSDQDVKAMTFGRHTKKIDPTTNEMVESHTQREDSWLDSEEGGSAIPHGEHVFDATRVASYMQRKDGKNLAYTEGDEKSRLYRTARAFSEGIGALSRKLRSDTDEAQLAREVAAEKAEGHEMSADEVDALRRTIEKANDELGKNNVIAVPDDTVVVKAKDGRPAVTWGELQQVLKDGKASEQVRAELHPLRAQRDALFDNRAKAREQVEKDNPDADAKELHDLMNASDAPFSKSIAAMNRKIDALRVKYKLDTESMALHKERIATEKQYEAAQARLKEAGNDAAQRDKINRDMKKDMAKIDAKLASLTDFEQADPQTRAEQLSELRAATGKATAALDAYATKTGKESSPHRAAVAEMRRQAIAALEALDAEQAGPTPRGAQRDMLTEQFLGDEQAKTNAATAPRINLERARAESAIKLADAVLGTKLVETEAGGIVREPGTARAMTPGEKAALRAFKVREARLDRLQARLDAGEKRDMLTRAKVEDGIPKEYDPNGNIHFAQAEADAQKKKLGELTGAVRGKAGDMVDHENIRSDYPPVTPEMRRDVLSAKADELAANGKHGLRTLLDNQGLLTKTHLKDLGKLVGEDGKIKSNADIATTLKSLTEQYQSDVRWSGKGEHAWGHVAAQGGKLHEHVLEKVGESRDVRALQTGLYELLADKKPNEHKAAVIDAVNARLGDLARENADAAYQLQLKSQQPTLAQKTFIDKLSRGGLSAKSVMDGIARAVDPDNLARAARALRLADSDNVHVARAMSRIADRLAVLRSGEVDQRTGATFAGGEEGSAFLRGDLSGKPFDRKANLREQIAELEKHNADNTIPDWYKVSRENIDEQVLRAMDPSGEHLMASDAAPRVKQVLADPRGVRAAMWDLVKHEQLEGRKELLDQLEHGRDEFDDHDGVGDMEYSRENKGSADSTAAQQKAVVDEINKVTGGDAEVNAAARMLYSGSFFERAGQKDANGADLKPLINVSVHAMNPMSTGYHEALHWFAAHLRKHGDPAVFAALAKVADSPYVRNFLREKFKLQPDALKQIEAANGTEERVAYMYQFHRSGELKLAQRGKTILDHIGDAIRAVFRVWSNDARALHIMDYFGSGKYAETVVGHESTGASVAHKAMMEVGRNATLDRLRANVKPLTELADAVGGIGSARVRDFGIPALTTAADMVRLHGTAEGRDAGYLPAAGVARRAFALELVNKMSANNTRPFTFEQANEALAKIGRKQDPATPDEARLMDAMRSTMSKIHGYQKDADVMIGARGLDADYTPRVWDPGFIAAHQDQFRAMAAKYAGHKDMKMTPDQLMSRLMRDEGSEIESPGDFAARPGNQHAKTRDLHFISFEDAEPFLQKNAMRVLNSYIVQATRRAEWSRRFEAMPAAEKKRIGWDAMSSYQRQQALLEHIANKQTPLDLLRARAVKEGASPEQMATFEKYLLGVTGQLGADVKPGTRRLFSQIMVYQNLRLLPMGFFSMLIDPLGLKVAGGSMKDVLNNYKRGILEIPRGLKKPENRKMDSGYQLAEDMGVIDSAVLQHVLGASYGMGAAGDTALKINEQLFKWNFMDQMNTSQRVGASEAALRFLLRHKDGNLTPHSLRYLGELGLKPADLKTIGTGKETRVAVRQEEFKQLGYSDEAALQAHLVMRQAVNRWVDNAILRPDQSNKAIWMNDPMFSLVAHMKQFQFAFQDTILKRVIHESRHGNYAPAAALAGYIPVMLAADMLRGAVSNGGAQPDWKQDWGVGDYLINAMQRAGLFGVGQFALDGLKDLHHGGLGVGPMGGPTASQLANAVSMVGGRRSLGANVLDAAPGNAAWRYYLPAGMTHPEADGGHGHKADFHDLAPYEPTTIDD